MREEPESLILVYLRRIDGKIDRLTDDVQDLKHRVTSLEGQVASIRGDMAAMSLRIDRIETRLEFRERSVYTLVRVSPNGRHRNPARWSLLVRRLICSQIDDALHVVACRGFLSLPKSSRQQHPQQTHSQS